MSLKGKENFFAAHYEWLVVGVGVLALAAAAAFYVMAIGENPEEAAQAAVAEVKHMKPSQTGVKEEDMTGFQVATKLTKIPVIVAEVPEKTASFLASERRVKRKKCGKAISGDVKAVPKCPHCGTEQEAEQVVVIDADGDGMPDEWEKKYGFNMNDPADADQDKDGDGFTNVEEYRAKTDPTNAKDHPDYLDSLKIVLPLKETYLPFAFTRATQVPGGWRCQFFDPKKKDVKRGSTGFITAKVGEKIGDYGFVLEKYEAKSEKRERKGMKGMMVSVDVSEATVVRKTDGKTIKLVIMQGKKITPVAVDVQATLSYERGTAKTFDVVPGSEIDLNGTKYKVGEIKAVGKGASVVVENALSGQKRTLKALEQ